MSQKKRKQEMASMKSREVSKTNRAIGSDDLLSVDAKASNDWIEGGAGANVLNGLGDFVPHVYAVNDAIFTARSAA